MLFISLDAKLAIAITANFVNRWSSEEQAVQEIGGISRLALKGQSHERIMITEQRGASCSGDQGHQQVSIKGTMSREDNEWTEQRGASCSGDRGYQQVSIKGTISREDNE